MDVSRCGGCAIEPATIELLASLIRDLRRDVDLIRSAQTQANQMMALALETITALAAEVRSGARSNGMGNE